MGQYLPVLVLAVLAILFAALSRVASGLLAPKASTDREAIAVRERDRPRPRDPRALPGALLPDRDDLHRVRHRDHLLVPVGGRSTGIWARSGSSRCSRSRPPSSSRSCTCSPTAPSTGVPPTGHAACPRWSRGSGRPPQRFDGWASMGAPTLTPTPTPSSGWRADGLGCEPGARRPRPQLHDRQARGPRQVGSPHVGDAGDLRPRLRAGDDGGRRPALRHLSVRHGDVPGLAPTGGPDDRRRAPPARRWLPCFGRSTTR